MSDSQTAATPGALDGIRVIEIASERGVSSPASCWPTWAPMSWWSSRLRGSPMRGHAPFAWTTDRTRSGASTWWHYNTSKRGVTLDLDSRARPGTVPEAGRHGRRAARVRGPGAAWPSSGSTTRTWRRSRPDLVVVSLTPFGRDTGKPDAQVTDLTVLAGGGPVWSCGYDDHSIPPVRGGGNQGYQTGAHYAVFSLLTALLHRGFSGEGQHIDVSLHAAANVTTEMSVLLLAGRAGTKYSGKPGGMPWPC